MKKLIVGVLSCWLATGCGQNPGTDPGALTTTKDQTAADEIMLSIGTIYDQGNTMWCWAFSAFHTLRTYYNLNSDSEPSVAAWRSAIKAIDTNSDFWRYLRTAFGSTNGDNPDRFIRQFKSDHQLPEQPWTKFYPSDYVSVREGLYGDSDEFPLERMPRKKILELVLANLRRNIPSVYCNPPHCMLIYGAVLDGSTVTQWAIGDSSGGRTYKKSARAVYNDLDLIMTLPAPSHATE